MKRYFIFILAALVLSFISTVAYGQDKTQAYYVQHEREILPDAQTAFREGNYERAAQLCRWHYIIVGDRAADSLRDKAENCQRLLDEINDLTQQGNSDAALEKALALLELNPEDSVAKELLMAAESAVSEPFDVEIQSVPESEPVTTEETPVYTVEPIMIPEPEPEPVPAPVEINEIPQYVTQAASDNETKKEKPVNKTKFGVKAGVSMLDLKNVAQSLAYGGSLGAYDIGGSRFGLEIGAMISPKLSGFSSLFEGDASLSIRISDRIYSMVTGGYFSCKSNENNSPATIGLCGGVGISFLIGNHFSIDVGGKYYPTIHVHQVENVEDIGGAYEYTSILTAISGGISPYLRLGILF